MWTIPLFFLGCAVMCYVFVPAETTVHLSELPVNSTNLSLLFSTLSVVTFVRDFIETRRGIRELETPTAAPLRATSSPTHSAPSVDPASRMRGVVIRGYGEGAVTVSDALARPEIAYADEVLVRVRAASVSPVDVDISLGRGRALSNRMRSLRDKSTEGGGELPIILGRDLSGVVEKVGSKVTKVKVGDEVWAALPFYRRCGGLADYAVVSEELLATKPDSLSHQEAASLPSVACSVWCSLVRTAVLGSKRTKDQRVLITGGTSSVGIFTVQLVKAWGGHVTVSCRDGWGTRLLKAQGADEVVNTSEIDLESSLKERPRFDVIVDTVGPSVRAACLALCARGGYVVSFATPVFDDADRYGVMVGSFVSSFSKMKLSWLRRCNFSWAFNLPEGKILDRVSKYVEFKRIRPVIDQIYRVDEARRAFTHVHEDQERGKAVVTFDAKRK